MRILTFLSFAGMMVATACTPKEQAVTTVEDATTNEVEEVAAEPVKSDLMVVIDMDDYATWRSEAFDPDAERRATVCDESRTTVAKISDNKAIVLMYDVDVEKMGTFMNEEAMKQLKEQFGAEHATYNVVPSVPGEGPQYSDLLVVVDMDDFGTWKSQAFDPDAERRSTVCDEEKTLVGKVSDNKAAVAMFNVNLPKMGEFMTAEAMEELMKAFGAKHQVFRVARIDQ